MAKQTLTLGKLATQGAPDTVQINSTSYMLHSTDGQPFEVNSPDPSKLFFYVYHKTTAAAVMTVSSTGATGARSGIGDATPLGKAVLTAGSSKEFVVGPFEPSRFADTSTGGKVIRLSFNSTKGSTDPLGGVSVTAIQFFPSTDGIILTT
jgi:hypothetical protein